MGAGIPEYDPRVIEQFADNLYRKASATVVGAVVIGAALGAAFGAVPLTSLGADWPVSASFGFATLLLGGLLGSVIGYVIGDARSFGYRLQAQAALCQLQIQRETAATARAVASLPAQAPREDPPVAPSRVEPAPQPAAVAPPRVEPPSPSPAAAPPRVVPAPDPAASRVEPPLPPAVTPAPVEAELAGTVPAPPLTPPVSP